MRGGRGREGERKAQQPIFMCQKCGIGKMKDVKICKNTE